MKACGEVVGWNAEGVRVRWTRERVYEPMERASTSHGSSTNADRPSQAGLSYAMQFEPALTL